MKLRKSGGAREQGLQYIHLLTKTNEWRESEGYKEVHWTFLLMFCSYVKHMQNENGSIAGKVAKSTWVKGKTRN